MGYMKHEAVIVTVGRDPFDAGKRVAAWLSEQSDEVRQLVVGPFDSPVNLCQTWVFLPDGSKEGLDASDAGDLAREQFKDLFRAGHDNGSSPYEWAHVVYGGDWVMECGVELTEVFPA